MKWLNENLSENVWYNYPEYAAYLEILSSKKIPGGPHMMHWHDDVEFLVVLSGMSDYTVNGDTFVLRQGDGVFVNARQMHYGTSRAEDNVQMLCVRLNPRVLCTSPFFESAYVLPVTQNHNMPCVKLRPEVEWQNRMLISLQEMYRHREGPTAHLRIHGLFCFLWSQLYENMPECTRADASSAVDLASIEAMIEHVEQHYTEKLTLGQIAEAGHVCESKCCRLFNKYLHKTPNLYLTHYRLGKAAELLVRTDQSITEIAFACGFSGASYFAETFRKCFDATPKEYRGRNRK